MGDPEVDAVDKSQVVVGEPRGRGWRGRRRRNGGTGQSGGASLTSGAARRATPTHCSASCTDCTKVSSCKGRAEEVHPLEASRTLKGVSAHIEVTDGAGVPGARMVTDGARVRMDIPTNKEQSQDKETSKESGQLEEEPPSCDLSTDSPAKKQSETMGVTFWSSPSGDLSCHFDPYSLGRGFHHHDEVAGRWCRLLLTRHIRHKIENNLSRKMENNYRLAAVWHQ